MPLMNTLSRVWTNVQYTLFPFLEEELGELSSTHKSLISILELVRIEQHLINSSFMWGRPPKDRSFIARAFIAKIVFKITYTKDLVRQLKQDTQLRRICGWESSHAVPSPSKFSRAFKEFAESSLPDRVHQTLIKNTYSGDIVGHVSKDSTPVIVREKHLKKARKTGGKSTKRYQKLKKGELNRRQKQLKETDLNKMISDLPSACDKGMKKSAQGYTMLWKGYKLHAAVDDHCIPLAVILTSASLNDCEVAIPLAAKCNKVVTNLYDLMDAAYDHPEIKQHSYSLGHVPVIDKCPTGAVQKVEKEAEKKRCKILNFKTAEASRYRERFKTERFNALFKDYYGGGSIRYRGHLKVSCEVMFGVLALTGSLLINLVS